MENQQKIDRFKSDVLSLCINSSKQFNQYKEYFSFLKESLHNYFGMEDCILLKVDGLRLNHLNDEKEQFLFNTQLTLKSFENYLGGEKIVNLPNFLKEMEYFENHTSMMLLQIDDQLEGILLFKYKNTNEPSYSNLSEELIDGIAFVFNFLVQSYNVKLNEQKFQKLYNMTDLFHSTMDIDVILENVLITIEENFPQLEVELILSNDQDRQTRIRIKQFDYLSERPSTIESFVSGELKEDEDTELDYRLLNAPIKGRQAIYGILQVKAPLAYTFTATEKEFIRMLAQVSGNSLENAKLYHQSHRLISDLQLINETSHRLNMKLSINEMLLFLQTQLLKSFQPMEIGFLFKEGETFEMTEARTAIFNTEAGQVYIQHVQQHFETTQDSLFIADFSRLLSEDIQYKSIMAIPMIVEEKINGFSIVLHEDPYFFSFDSFKLMQSLIHHSSLAISNSILREKLQEMVDRDHLTKLFARSYSDTYVEKSIDKDDSGMFLLIDIDNFKRVNDTYGHQVGDGILMQIGSQLQQEIGTRGICSRWGGEELAIYIPNILDHEALKISNEIVDIIPRVTNPTVTISAGMITWNKSNRPDFQEIFLQADTALYSAKHNGKNRVCVFEDTMQLQS
ncbi:MULTISPECIES: GGDEF domain-containing protein [unclassified Lysinibacillus]|uniref:sensor domain-containing diguanylate cyclase n=1 Tax=unclassified Lysinibacillus TaxID=2636778 RepID=UPI001F118F97|nr:MULTISPECIES: GGDEF domain-containing protein [unclassified Lysinibacillus]